MRYWGAACCAAPCEAEGWGMRPARIRLFPVGPLIPVPRLTEEQCGLVDEIEGLGGEPLGARGNRLLRRLVGVGGGEWGGGGGGGCGGVEWVGAGGRYRVTKLGGVARSLGVSVRRRGRKRKGGSQDAQWAVGSRPETEPCGDCCDDAAPACVRGEGA